MSTTRCAVVGDPIDHSLSPVLHRAAYDALGLADWEYDAVQVPAGGLAGFVADLAGEWRGLSVTAPLKREALALAETATDRARLAGAANTLVRTATGWAADNTDIPGAVAAIRERYEGPVTAATILGAGATAASIGLALADLGATAIRILARDPGRAAETVEVLAAHPSGLEIEVLPLDGTAVRGEVVVSTVPAAAQVPPVLAETAAAAVVFEVVYHPWPTPLAAAAQSADQVLVSGLDLLVHQAVLQVEQFTGQQGPRDAMRSAGEHALAAR
jgi:shikimate dehydrogenase